MGMTMQQAVELSRAAKAKGYATQAQAGRIRFVVLDKNGDVELAITGWLGYKEARAVLDEE